MSDAGSDSESLFGSSPVAASAAAMEAEASMVGFEAPTPGEVPVLSGLDGIGNDGMTPQPSSSISMVLLAKASGSHCI